LVQVSIAGSTGSVGTQALDVISANSDQFEVVALLANSNVDLLVEQANQFRPKFIGIFDEKYVPQLREGLGYSPEIVTGSEASAGIAELGQVVLNAVVGFAGLPVTLSTLQSGKRLALANKESLVAAGELVSKVRAKSGSEIIPVDSEHSAIHQALRSGNHSGDEVSRLILTASGGPFRLWDWADLESVTLEDALAHPTWSMGQKISVDSSTLMNKGLEVIEAQQLFAVDYDRIDVVVHPQSLVHSMVEFRDGSAIAQISGPDMRLPIGYALSYPDRLTYSFAALDWGQVRTLQFEPPDHQKFPSLHLAYQVGKRGGAAPTWLNAANEIAVRSFIEHKIRWIEIFETVRASLEQYQDTVLDSIEDVLEIDFTARRVTEQLVRERGNN
jgi:1-deoxy-D-xylulose-5-phosphate reductoisomerase